MISNKPFFSFKQLFDRSRSSDSSVVSENVMYFKSGRVSLLAALQNEKFSKEKYIILPALICDSVPKTLLNAGYKPLFVDVSLPDLSFEKSKFKEQFASKEVGAVLLVHFFGFVNDISEDLLELIRKKQCLIIEDWCHSAFPEETKCKSDYAIFSYRKTLRCGAGGALYIKKSHDVMSLKFRRKDNKYELLAMTLLILEWVCIKKIGLNIYGKKFTAIKELIKVNPQKNKSISEDPQVGSKVPKLLLGLQLRNQVFLDSVSESRKKNYETLQTGICCSISLLFEGKVSWIPQVLPVLDLHGGLNSFLRDNGVGSFCWPGNEMPKCVVDMPSDFPIANKLKNEIVCLPVHQSISVPELGRISELVKSYVNTKKISLSPRQPVSGGIHEPPKK